MYNEKIIKKCAIYDSFVCVEKSYSSTKKLLSILEKKIELYSSARIIFMQVLPDVMEYSEFEEILCAHPEITFYMFCTI